MMFKVWKAGTSKVITINKELTDLKNIEVNDYIYIDEDKIKVLEDRKIIKKDLIDATNDFITGKNHVSEEKLLMNEEAEKEILKELEEKELEEIKKEILKAKKEDEEEKKKRKIKEMMKQKEREEILKRIGHQNKESNKQRKFKITKKW